MYNVHAYNVYNNIKQHDVHYANILKVSKKSINHKMKYVFLFSFLYFTSPAKYICLNMPPQSRCIIAKFQTVSWHVLRVEPVRSGRNAHCQSRCVFFEEGAEGAKLILHVRVVACARSFSPRQWVLTPRAETRSRVPFDSKRKPRARHSTIGGGEFEGNRRNTQLPFK